MRDDIDNVESHGGAWLMRNSARRQFRVTPLVQIDRNDSSDRHHTANCDQNNDLDFFLQT